MDLKQSVTLAGLGVQHFDKAVLGLATVYQLFKTHLLKKGLRLRELPPKREGEEQTVTFSNRYLTSWKDAEGDIGVDLGSVVDPFNILRPLMRTEVHTQENVVEYWEKSKDQ